MDRPEDRDSRVRRLFDELLELQADQREARIREIRRQDPSLAEELSALIAAHNDANAVLNKYVHRIRSYRNTVVGADSSRHRLVGQTVAHYVVLEWLGGGGMGDVFKAWDTRLERTVALKFLPPDLSMHDVAQQRFVQEAKSASVLDHPNICTIYEIGESSDGRLYIAMPCYGGETLREKIERGPLPVDEAVNYAIQMAEGLQRAHDAGIVHRDIKPANVMVTEHGHVKLLDFGIAKIASMEATRTGARFGTVAYMSPEYARGEPADHRMDIWSLGVVLYEMLTGARPFPGAHEASILLAIQKRDPLPVRQRRPEVQAPLAHIVERCLQKNPGARYNSMQELVDDLRRPGKPAGPAMRLKPLIFGAPARLKRLVRDPVMLAVAAGLAVLAAAGVWQWLAASGPSSPAPDHSIAVMYFENLTGDASLDWIEAAMVEMLTANFGRFENVDVLSSQRLFDIMRQVSGEASGITRSTATDVARRAGVRTMLMGSILGRPQHLRLNTQFVDVASGDLVSAEVVDVGPDGSLFALADELTERLAALLDVKTTGPSSEAHVAYSLTTSPRALRHYVDGLQAMYRSNFSEAIDQFDAAVESDSTFAMAYYHRELAYSWQTGTTDREALERALQFGDRISERERALIEATFTMLEDLPTRKAAFERLTRQYTDEKFAWYQLGEILYHNYWPRASAAVFQRSIELDPHFLIAYIHLADFYFHTDQHEAVRPLLDRVFAVDSANTEFRLNEAFVLAAGRHDEPARARLTRLLERAVEDSTTNPYATLDAEASLAMMTKDFARIRAALESFRREGLYGTEGYVLPTNSLAGIALLEGDLREAERYLNEARLHHPGSPTQLYEEGLFRLLSGDTEAARTNASEILRIHESGTAPFPEVATLGLHLQYRSHLAADDAAGARRALTDLERLTAEADSENGFLLDDARGRAACLEGRPDAAIQYFREARSSVSFTGTHTGVVLLFNKLILDAELECLERSEAHEALLRRIDDVPIFVYHFHDLNASTMAVWLRTLRRRAHALEALGRIGPAIEAYQEFLSYWTDPALPGVRDARERLARLTDLQSAESGISQGGKGRAAS